ncbi:MAG: N-acetylneuraminate synthase family protein [Ilumatobacteraceae bacterium]
MTTVNQREIIIAGRPVGDTHVPLVIPEIGINHGGKIDRAIRMIDDVAAAGGECVKFQAHGVDDEMIPNDVVPGNSTRSIWDIIDECTLTPDEELSCKKHAESLGLIYLSTPFSREAADRLGNFGVEAFKIGSGECNNIPLIRHIAKYHKPIIVSTGMNDAKSIQRTVEALEEEGAEFALLHCTSMYPTPYESVRLGSITQLRETYPNTVIGISDHTLSNLPALAAVALGASIIERHFTSDKSWVGEDISISIDPGGLKELIDGSKIVHAASGGSKTVLAGEQPTIDFAYASVVSISQISAGDVLTDQNIWVKRPGTGEILAFDFNQVVGKRATRSIGRGEQLKWTDVE